VTAAPKPVDSLGACPPGSSLPSAIGISPPDATRRLSVVVIMMSVENLDGDGYADQPSIVYGFDETATTGSLPDSAQALLDDTAVKHTDNEDINIRELSRSGWAQPGPSPGDVIERDSTQSTLDTRLPDLDLPGSDGLNRDDCGEDIPAFACLDGEGDNEGCGKPVFVGRSCANPTCSRDWPAAVKDKTLRLAGKLDSYARILHKRTGKPIHQNHVVASLPGLLVDSEMPVDRAYEILKTILRHQWGIEGFAAIYHPYRIKQEYRADQYSHGGADGEGDMTWKDVLTSDDPMQYLKFEPHFHLFFPAPQGHFEYSVVPGVYKDSGWVFHRIEKGGEDNHVSVEDLEDLVHQITYCFSHCGVNDWYADRDELTSRMKGELATDVEYVPESTKDEVLAHFCEAAPKLLGTRFVNLNEATCDAEVSSEPADSHTDCDCEGDDDSGSEHPLHDVWDSAGGITSSSSGGGADPFPSDVFDTRAPSGGSSGDSSGERTSLTVSTSAAVKTDVGALAASEGDGESDVPITDSREPCGGELKPIRQAESRLDDDEWCRQAEYVAGLRDAFEEWRRRTGGEEDLPWTDGDRDGGGVVRDSN